VPGYRPPFIDNTPSIGDAGTYISQTVNLDNPADQLNVIMDIMHNHNSFVNVYYQTQADVQEFFFSGRYGQTNLDPSINLPECHNEDQISCRNIQLVDDQEPSFWNNQSTGHCVFL
jgi:hypothetical protein